MHFGRVVGGRIDTNARIYDKYVIGARVYGYTGTYILYR